MNTDIDNNQPLVVCLHASASSSRQWNTLAERLQEQVRVVMPDLVGYGNGDDFQARQSFRFEHEISNILRQIEEQTGKTNGPLHLVGHSYGGAAALYLARMYPERVASLTLYEPAQFMLLFDQGLQDELASEVVDVWRFAKARLNSVSGRRVAAKCFIDYWSGEGAWDSVPVKRQRRFASLMPKVVAEFDAILSSGTSIADLAGLNIPVRLIHGDRTRKTAARVIEVLSQTLPDVENIRVEGAAHMAPTTHASLIDPLFAEHVLACLNNSLRVAA